MKAEDQFESLNKLSTF